MKSDKVKKLISECDVFMAEYPLDDAGDMEIMDYVVGFYGLFSAIVVILLRRKAQKFAKTINDDHYISKIRKRLAQVDQRVIYSKTKKEGELNKDLQLRELVKANIVRLGKTETLKNIAEIRKYCQLYTTR